MVAKIEPLLHSTNPIFRRILCRIVVCAFAAILVSRLYTMSQHSVPEFEGRSFVYWLKKLPGTVVGTNSGPIAISYIRSFHYGTVSEILSDQARAHLIESNALTAVRLLGTNHLELLIRDLRQRSLPFESTVLKILFNTGLIDTLSVRSCEMSRWQALTAIAELGDRATALVPELIQLRQNKDPSIARAAEYALDRIQMPAQWPPPSVMAKDL